MSRPTRPETRTAGRRLAVVVTSVFGLLAATWLDATPIAHADFSASGRNKKKKRVVTPKASTVRGPSAAPQPSTDSAATGAEPKKQSSDTLIQRYTGIVLNQPGAAFPLQRLAQLYRERDGNLDALIAELGARADAGNWNALVALAGVYKEASKQDLAAETYERAVTAQPKNPLALLAWAQLLMDRGEKALARARFEQALPLVAAPTEQEQILRTLLGLTLDLGDFAAAKKLHASLVTRAKGSFFVRAELGREFLVRGKYELAEAEYREVVRFASGDHRALGPALRDLGTALAKQKKFGPARETLERALTVAGAEAGLRREIFDRIVDVYRGDDRLPELILLLGKERSRDFERTRLLGELYEETGQIDKAIQTYRQALTRQTRDIGVRLRLVQLLQIQGDLPESVAQYEELVRVAPSNPDFSFQLAESLLQQGERQRALDHLAALERRSQNDEDTLTALVDFYERVGESEKALALLERLARFGAADPGHLVELGARHYEKGDVAKAEQIWKRILTVVPDRARAHYTLGEVYLEHDLTDEALKALETATELAPKETSYRKAYALALERVGAANGQRTRGSGYADALKIWEQLLAGAGADKNLEREARQHIVTLWALGGRIEERIAPLERRLSFVPPDLDAGRLLAEVFVRVRRVADAERVLGVIIEHAPGDAGSLLLLERAQVTQRKLVSAIETLKKLATLDPQRAREYYQRMAQYAAEQYLDDEAIEYSSKALELNPDDALGHQKLAEMYRRRQEVDKAIAEYWKAIAKNDRAFPVYLELAELLIASEHTEEADKLLRRVVRSANDDELVSRAARISTQLNLGRGTLESLERELLPIALANPRRPLFRRLLVEIYGAMTLPLVHATQSSEPKLRMAAEDQLAKLGNRAVKPLLDALNDQEETQASIAIEILSHLRNPSAGPALVAYATGAAPVEQRTRAMNAAGAIASDALLPRLVQALTVDGQLEADDADPVAIAAVRGILRVSSRASRALLRRLVGSSSERVRALCALGLGLGHERGDLPRLVALAQSPSEGQLVRAVAAFAGVELASSTRGNAPELGSALAELAEIVGPRLKTPVLVSLARLRTPGAAKRVAEALLNPDDRVRAAGLAAARVLAASERPSSVDASPATLAQAGASNDVEELVERLIPGPYAPDVDLRALTLIEPELTLAVGALDGGDAEQIRLLSERLLSRGGKPALAPLTDRIDQGTPEAQKSALAAAGRITTALLPTFLSLARHPSPRLRATAARFLATRSEDAARAALSEVLADDDALVQATALEAVAVHRPVAVLPAVLRVLSNASAANWAIRVQAAETLGSLLSALAPSEERTGAFTELARAARADEFALVREAALVALSAADRTAALATLEAAKANDPEPRVQAAARRLLEGRDQ